MTTWLQEAEWLGNPALHWFYALAGALLGYVLARGLLHMTARLLREREARRPWPARQTLIALIGATRHWLLLLLALAVAARVLELPDRLDLWLGRLEVALIGLQVTLWITRLIDRWLERATADATAERRNPVMLGILRWGAHFLVWVTLVMVLMANAGVNITAMVASLGVGGVAVALALQTVLGDLFSSISIGLDKPFEVGEFIAFGEVRGTVLQVGVKSTRIASLTGEQLVISNSNLLKELVHNYSRMQERRIVFGFRLPYGTPRAQVQSVVDAVRAHIEREPLARFDRGHLARFGEYGLEFEFVYFVLDPAYNVYADLQQRINFEVMDLLERMGLPFAVPVRSVQVADRPGFLHGAPVYPAPTPPGAAAGVVAGSTSNTTSRIQFTSSEV